MITLKANSELKNTFEKLIGTMKVPVKWNGIFVVIDNYIILQGEVRSLFFHFDSRKAVTNLIDLTIKEDEVINTAENIWVRNVINMILYAFGKWGTIKGLRVEKNYAQLNQLFAGVMKDLRVQPEYTQEHFRFYKEGIRITYEEVIATALEATEEAEENVEEEAQGLWHKIIWKKAGASFPKVETTLKERQKERLGNNFYMVGYCCPVCKEKLHMAVYPVDKEFRIETEEGAVLLARAYTCKYCNSFYTPRPDRMLSEGDVYLMQFEDDRKAYEDYLELLGKGGARVSNYRYNRFEDGRSGRREEESLEELCENLSEYSEEELEDISARMEEGFYPDESIIKCEERVKENVRRRSNRTKGERAPDISDDMISPDREDESGKQKEGGRQEKTGLFPHKEKKRTDHAADRRGEPAGSMVSGQEGMKRSLNVSQEGMLLGKQSVPDSVLERMSPRTDVQERVKAGGDKAEQTGGSEKEQDAVRQKYNARMQVMDRMSGRQLRELESQLNHESRLPAEEKQEYLKQVQQAKSHEITEQLSQKVRSCEGKNYALLRKVQEEVERADVLDEMKQPLLEKLKDWKMQQAGQEVRQLMEKMPPRMDRTQYRHFMDRIKSYDDVDLTPYESQLKSSREQAERQEIANTVRNARKNTREDLSALVHKLRDGDFLTDLILPYVEKLEGKIRELDQEEIEEICGDPAHLSFEEGMTALEKIEQGEFLPELKTNALEMLTKRLTRIKTDESELLVRKLQEELKEAGIAENARHHFYPAKRILLKQAEPEETEVIDFAMASYAAGCGMFEYPVLVVDTSRNESGKEGMILTTEHLYYSTLFSAYGIGISTISKIKASAGLLNKGLYVHQKNGTKTKIPYAVESKDLPALAEVLNSFVRYLQEKPDSRNVTYLAEEKHEKICCFRCGYVYKGGNACPKCGYKSNG